jgi:hypothetical protein
VYHTSISGGDAYKFFTFTSPTVLNGASADVEAYRVRIPTPTATYIKSQYKWTYDSTLQSYTVDLIFGVGDQNGKGQAHFSKTANGFDYVYDSRTSGVGSFGVAMDDGEVYAVYNSSNYPMFIKKEYASIADAQADTSLPVGAYAIIVGS